MFKDKTLLVTGGTGSFGETVVQKFLQTDIGEIRILSRDEKKQYDMRSTYASDKLSFFIGDVRDASCLIQPLAGVDYVFHAAALKQVPSCEFFPLEAYKTNVIGTQNIIDACSVAQVSKLICLSTDKAVYPINAMGISKAMMEKVAIASSLNCFPTVSCTRYGNVMASRGSVIPLFVDQVIHDLPLTITNPNMSRYMMTLDQAVELVLFAFLNANRGDIFVQKSPAASLSTLADAIKTIFDKPNHPVRVLGTRHGEKLHESLMSSEEMCRCDDLGDYYKIPSDVRDLNYDKYFNGSSDLSQPSSQNLEYNSSNAYQLSTGELVDLLTSLPFMQEFL